MKKYFTHLLTALLAGACLATASCKDSDDTDKAGPQTPNYPDPVTATVEAGGTYTIPISPNMDWKVSVPAEVGSWFWIQDGATKTMDKRGPKGDYEIVIGVADIQDYDQNRVCEVKMQMGSDQPRTIATLTLGKLERELKIYACQIDSYGSFVFNSEPESGLSYLYEAQPTDATTLIWPEELRTYMMQILVEANFDWGVEQGAAPEWLTLTHSTGKAGEQVEISLRGDATKYPLDGATGTLSFNDPDTPGQNKFSIEVTLPACKDEFKTSVEKDILFNHLGEFNSSTGWTPGAIRGTVRSIEGTKFFLLAEVTPQWGDPYLGWEAEEIGWLHLQEDAWDAENGVIQERSFELAADANPGNERKAILLALPPAVAADITEPQQLVDQMLRPEYEQYVIANITQRQHPGPLSAKNTEKQMLEIGAAFEKLPAGDWTLGQFGVDHGYKLTYTKQWSNDPESTLVSERAFTVIETYDYDLNPLQAPNDWLKVRTVEGGFIVDMIPAKDPSAASSQGSEGIAHMGFVVLSDAEGKIALIQCIYDETIQLGGDETFTVAFVDEQAVEGATLVAITQDNYVDLAAGDASKQADYAEGLGMGYSLYLLTYTSATPKNTLLSVGSYNSIMIMPMSGAEWCDYEAPGDGQLQITMAKPAADQQKSAMVQFLDGAWSIFAIIYCEPAF